MVMADFLFACLILLDLGAPVDPGDPYAITTTQDAFGTWGSSHILSLVTVGAMRALKEVGSRRRRRLCRSPLSRRVSHYPHVLGALWTLSPARGKKRCERGE
jgi:hypothetical protein